MIRLLLWLGTIAGALAVSAGAPRAAAAAGDPVILAAGDIATCANTNDSATAELLDGLDGTILILGDLAYEDGTAAQFANCYDPTWGRHKARTRPSPGNHEYRTAGAAPYYAYFGASAGDPTKGYYSFDIGNWHIISLNSNCNVVSCAAGSAQEMWLRADLAASTKPCTLAYWHHARFSSGNDHGNDASVAPFWSALYEYGAEVALVSHEHVYERFDPQSPAAAADPNGLRQFTVGTGGRSLDGFLSPQPNSVVRDASAYGVLKMTLHSNSYDWRFVPVEGESFEDSGSASCNSTLLDGDSDGITDSYEVAHLCLDEGVADADTDHDVDGLTSGGEFAIGTDACAADSDGDGCGDGDETGPDEQLGGARSPLDTWDYYELTGDGGIDLSDAIDVLGYFGDPAFAATPGDLRDRLGGAPAAPWRTREGVDGVDLTDALANLASFGHGC